MGLAEKVGGTKISTLPHSRFDKHNDFRSSQIFSIPISQFQPLTNDSLYHHLRGYLIFGRLLGIIPFQGVFSSNLKNLRYKLFTLPHVISICTSLLMTVCTISATIWMIKAKKTTPVEIAYSGGQTAFFSYALFVYSFFRRNSQQIIDYFHKWQNTSLHFTKEDVNMRRYVFLTVGVLFTSAILENAVYNIKMFTSNDKVIKTNIKEDIKSPLEFYYETEYPDWAHWIQFNPVLAVILFIANKYAIYAWNYADIIIALISRVIYFKFKALTEVAENQRILFYGNKEAELLFWMHVVDDYAVLNELLLQMAKLLSPLIFASYAINSYTTCLLIYQALTPSANTTVSARLYSIWSFIQMTGRVFVFTLAAAKINDYAKGVRNLYNKCPNDCYTLKVRRAEDQVSSAAKIGFHGMNCFVITKTLMLKLCFNIFSFEIILLQSNFPVTNSTAS